MEPTKSLMTHFQNEDRPGQGARHQNLLNASGMDVTDALDPGTGLPIHPAVTDGKTPSATTLETQGHEETVADMDLIVIERQ